MKGPVHVVCASNAAYMMPLCVMLASLVEHFDPQRELRLHIISNDATEQDRANVRQSVDLNARTREFIAIHWYSLDDPRLMRLPNSCHFSRDVYARLFAPHILPESCERVVYLDCDMVVLADISKLYDSADGSTTLLQAVHHVRIANVSTEQGGVFDYAERRMPADTRYFGSGVLVINLKLWRERGLTPQMIDYLAKNGTSVFFDQGALNAFLALDWTPLDPRWNQSSDVLFPEFWDAAGYARKEWRHTRNNPYIVHFSGPKKPWQKGRLAPRYSYFYRYLQKTVFKDSIPHRPFLENMIGTRAYYHLWSWARKIIPSFGKS